MQYDKYAPKSPTQRMFSVFLWQFQNNNNNRLPGK